VFFEAARRTLGTHAEQLMTRMRKRIVTTAVVALTLLTSLIASAAPPAPAEARGRSVPRYDGVLILGDSLTTGVYMASPAQTYPARLLALLRQAGLLQSGATVGVIGLQARNAGPILDKYPHTLHLDRAAHHDLVVVELGTNDHNTGGLGVSAFAAAYAALLARVQAGVAPGARLVCLTAWAGDPGHTQGDPTRRNAGGASIADYGRAIAQTCRGAWKKGPVQVVDLVPLAAKPADHLPPGTIQGDDGFHPSATGYAQIAQTVYRAASAR